MYVCAQSCPALSLTPWTVAHQAPLSMGFSRQEYWSRLPFPPPGDLLDPGIQPNLMHWQVNYHCTTWKVREGAQKLEFKQAPSQKWINNPIIVKIFICIEIWKLLQLRSTCSFDWSQEADWGAGPSSQVSRCWARCPALCPGRAWEVHCWEWNSRLSRGCRQGSPGSWQEWLQLSVPLELKLRVRGCGG